MSVLVISWDKVGERMAGSAIRTLELARALAASGLEVTLAAPEGSELAAAGRLRLETIAAGTPLTRLTAAADVVVVSGRVELMTAVKKPLVIDLYDPFVLSNLDLYGDGFNRSRGRSLLSLRWLAHHLETGDFFLCASATQRSFWLGMLAAAGRINHANYADDPELRRLLAIVPFGVPDEPPRRAAPVVKGVLPGIAESDRVVTWAGGMWNWVDPLTLLRAVALLRGRRPEVKALILGTRHPNPEIGEMAIARRARELAAELRLTDGAVTFVDWVPYAERHRYLLESDVGVSLHRSGVESEFAFRTRVLDYVWCGVPMVVTAGDELASRVERDDLGRVVPPDDSAAVASAIESLLDAPDAAARSARIAATRASLAWSRVVEPLREFCAAPRHAPDRRGDAWFSSGGGREWLPRKEQALIAEEMVTDARAISPPLGPGFSPRQRFTAAYDGLCQVEVLFWVEPPVGDANLLFELSWAGDEPQLAARVLVPAAQLPHCDWQRFEFRPLQGSRGRDFELRLSLTETSSIAGAAGPTAAGGRVCVWCCAPPPGERTSGDGVAFIARYLVGGVVEEMPTTPEDFLFLHNTTVPLLDGTAAPRIEPQTPIAAEAEAVDVEGLRAELARVTAQAAAAQQKADALGAALDARIRSEARDAARAEVRAHMTGGALVVAALEGLFRSFLGLARLARRALVLLAILALTLASVPLALAVALGIALTDLIARRRGRRAPTSTVAADGPRSDGPVSIVIPTWNGRSLLDMSLPPLLEALRRHGHPDDEIIVVDNGSDDDTIASLERRAAEASQLRWIALPTNEGFGGATNRGAREAKNPTLILLNNDMVVEPDFIQPLLDAFAGEPDLFGVSCQIDFIDPGKPRWETGKVHGELQRGIVRLFHLDRFDEDLLYPVFFAGGGASAYDRAKFLALGGFDEAVYSPIYIEDVDLGYRAWKRGWPSVIAPKSKVHHKHRSTTRRRWSEERIHSFFVKNLAALVWKNVGSWRLLARHLAALVLLPVKVFRDAGGRSAVATFQGLVRQVGVTLRARLREAEHAHVLSDEEIFHLSRYRHAYRARFHPGVRDDARPQVLIVSPYSPAPAVHGGAVRMLNLIREIRARCDVTLISFVDTEAERRIENLALLRDLCRDVALVPRDLHAGGGGRLEPAKTRGFDSQAMRDQVEWWLDRRRFDVVQVEYTHMAHYLPPPCAGLRRVLVEHDVTFVAQARARRTAPSRMRRLMLWYDGLRTLRHEVHAVEGADLVLTMSDDDRAVLARFVDPEPLVTVPNGVSCRDFPVREQGSEETATVLFVGFFRHEPNVEAVLWFARDVLPLVRARVPETIFRVVGAYPPQALETLAAADARIEVTGMVPETASHYRRATVFVAPILRGSGTRLKILEAMASGCPVVSTTVGAEGLGASSSEIVIGDDARALAEGVCGLLADPARRRTIAQAARAFVERTYDWPAIARRLLATYGFAGDAGSVGARAAASDGAAPAGSAGDVGDGSAPVWAARGGGE